MKFSKKVSIAALLLLAVLLTQFAYSYWVGTVNVVNAEFGAGNTLQISASQGEDTKVTLNWELNSPNRTNFAYVPSGYVVDDKTQSDVNYVLVPVKVSVDKNENVLKGVNRELTLTLSEILNKDKVNIENNKSASGDTTPMFIMNYSIVSEKIENGELANRFGELNGKMNHNISLEDGDFYVLIEIRMENAPKNKEHYDKVQNTSLEFKLTYGFAE